MAVVSSGGVFATTHRATSPARSGMAIPLYGDRRVDLATLYREQPNLRLVIRFLARNIAQLGLKAYRRTSATEREELERGHPLRAFLRSPVSMAPVPVSRYDWIRGLVEDFLLYDELYALKLRNPVSGVLSVPRVPPPTMTPTGEEFLWPEGFVLRGNKGERHFEAGAVLYMHGNNPDEPRTGLPPAEALRRILAEDDAAGTYREQFWRNSARTSGILSRPPGGPKWSEHARERFLSDWRAQWSGAGPDAGGTPLLEDGMTYTDSGFSAKDSEYLASRRLTREECAAQYFVPPVFVGILEYANFSNIKEQHVSLYADTLGPYLAELTGGLVAQLVPEFEDVEDVYLEFNIEAKLAGRFEEQALALQTATGAPWLLRAEARARMNLPPVPGLDEPVVPLNVLIGGQASPTDSAPPPSGAAAVPAAHVKERDGTIPPYLATWETKHLQELAGFVDRQRASVLSRLGSAGSGADIDSAFEVDRWNTDLGSMFLALSLEMSSDVGGQVAEQYGSEFDIARAEPWLAENARIAAEGVNGATLAALREAWSGVPRGTNSKALEDELAGLGLDLLDSDTDDAFTPAAFLEPARGVFLAVLVSRVPTLARTRSTAIGQWARREGAAQAGVRTKTWIASGSPNSRHAALDGETVPISEPFSNGGQWPGDPALGADETAGCLCSLDFGT